MSIGNRKYFYLILLSRVFWPECNQSELWVLVLQFQVQAFKFFTQLLHDNNKLNLYHTSYNITKWPLDSIIWHTAKVSTKGADGIWGKDQNNLRLIIIKLKDFFFFGCWDLCVLMACITECRLHKMVEHIMILTWPRGSMFRKAGGDQELSLEGHHTSNKLLRK